MIGRLLVMFMCGTVLLATGATDARAQRAAPAPRARTVAGRAGTLRAHKQKLVGRLRRAGKSIKRNLRRSPEAWKALRMVRQEARAVPESMYGDPSRAAEVMKTARPDGLRARLEVSYAQKRVDRAMMGAHFETGMEAMRVVAEAYRRGEVSNLGMTGKYVTRYLDTPRGDVQARRKVVAEASQHGVDLQRILDKMPSWRLNGRDRTGE